MKTLEEKLTQKLRNKLSLIGSSEKELKICIACSAGVDSTVLFHILQRVSKSFKNVRFAIAHVNYHLRGAESDLDEKFLANLAQESKVPFFNNRPEKTKKIHEEKIGIQAWARKARYDFFEALVEKGWVIALAHTEDDLLETILLRLLRGTSPLAARGMSEHHNSFWRPLLETKKSALKVWAKSSDISWREDQSNTSRDYSRNKLRLDTLPEFEALYPGSGRRIIRFAEQSHELAVFAKKSLKERLESHLVRDKDTVSIELKFFCDLNRAVTCLFLAEILREFTHGSYVPENKILMSLYEWILENPETKGQKQLSQDMFCKIHQNKLVFLR